MVNRFVRVVFAQSIVRGKRVGEHLRAGFNILINFRLQDATASLRNVLQFDLAATFQKSHDNFFSDAARAASALAALFVIHGASLATNVCFIRLDFARKFFHRAVLHGEPDAMQHKPSCLLSDAKRAAQFAGANSILGVHNHPESGKPFVKAKRAILKNCSGFGRKLFLAVAAFPQSARGKKRRIGLGATGAARLAVRPAHRRHEVQRGVRIREVFDCRRQCFRKLNCIFHANNFAQNLW
jgi:hypothetical protein